MKKSQLFLSLIAIIFAAVGALASTAVVTNAAKAQLTSSCPTLTTVEDGCTLVNGDDVLRCTVSTVEGTKDAFFTTTNCTIGLYREDPDID